MRIYIYEKDNNSELIPVLEICYGLLFLILKIYDIYEFNKFLNGTPQELLQLVSYAPMTYGDILPWTVSIFAGSFYWVNKKIYWMLTTTFLCLMFFKVELSLIWHFNDRLIQIIIFSLFILYLFIKMIIKLFNIKEVKSTIITSKIKLSGIALSIIACFIYGYLEIINPFRYY